MTTPAFSIVIPTYNRSDLFPYAVESIFKQSFQDFEIIVSDNCSADDTQQIAQTIHRLAGQVRSNPAPFHDRRFLGIRQVPRSRQTDLNVIRR